MTIDSVRAFMAEHAPDIAIVETAGSSATVPLAAAAHGVATGQIAKTLSLRLGEEVVLVVASGDARLDNKKCKSAFGVKPRMLGLEEVAALTGHPVGGVCPFGLAQPLRILCDVSLKAYDVVVPAAGSINSALFITPDRLASITGAAWVDVCQDPAA
ncbi:YbaK/EbsC family protein [Zavarzinia sp.]|uniref:YbaK/EbsC family protein n=1 Tax=Zavarzinia sp. TaxID=2027920 RepID=UPI003568060F